MAQNVVYWHRKSGKTVVVLLGLADHEDVFIEATMTPAVVYREIGDGQIFVRPVSEFLDGRFEAVTQFKILQTMESGDLPMTEDQKTAIFAAAEELTKRLPQDKFEGGGRDAIRMLLEIANRK